MIIALSDNRQIEVKNINLVGGTVDYRRINDPVYSGDCMGYLKGLMETSTIEEVEAAIMLAIEVDCGLAEYPPNPEPKGE